MQPHVLRMHIDFHILTTFYFNELRHFVKFANINGSLILLGLHILIMLPNLCGQQYYHQDINYISAAQ